MEMVYGSVNHCVKMSTDVGNSFFQDSASAYR